MALGIYIPDRVEGEREIEVGPGMRSRDEIERLQWQFRRSVNDLLSVEVGPALEMPNEPEQVPRLIDKASDQLTGINVLFRRFIQVEDTQDLERLPEIINLLEGMTQILKEVKAA